MTAVPLKPAGEKGAHVVKRPQGHACLMIRAVFTVFEP